jgi:hypothetical protein
MTQGLDTKGEQEMQRGRLQFIGDPPFIQLQHRGGLVGAPLCNILLVFCYSSGAGPDCIGEGELCAL